MRDKNTGKYESDLFRFKAFGANAEFANKFLQKGDCVEIESHIINFAYIKDNQRVYKMDFLIDHIGYLPYKKRNIPGINERLAKTIDYMPEDPFLAYDNIDIPPIKQSVGHSYDKVPF
jgi:single-stranded DNA-binding protein